MRQIDDSQKEIVLDEISDLLRRLREKFPKENSIRKLSPEQLYEEHIGLALRRIVGVSNGKIKWDPFSGSVVFATCFAQMQAIGYSPANLLRFWKRPIGKIFARVIVWGASGQLCPEQDCLFPCATSILAKGVRLSNSTLKLPLLDEKLYVLVRGGKFVKVVRA